ncbi:glycosyltransferase family 25 protein [Methylobacterium phyllosphaerae]
MHRNDFLQIVRPDAVEGRNLDRDELARTGMIHRDLRYTNPALGNAHSHIGLWTKAADEDVCVTIAEDDAIFFERFSCRGTHNPGRASLRLGCRSLGGELRRLSLA